MFLREEEDGVKGPAHTVIAGRQVRTELQIRTYSDHNPGRYVEGKASLFDRDLVSGQPSPFATR